MLESPSSSFSMLRGENADTRTGSISTRSSTAYPAGDFRNLPVDGITNIKCDVMVNWLYQQQAARNWSRGSSNEGVILKRTGNSYACCPSDLQQRSNGLLSALQQLNVRVALTVNTGVVRLFMTRNDLIYVPLPDGLRLQVLPDMSFLPMCQKHHFAAFLKDTSLLVVWDDEPHALLERAKEIESQLMALVWWEARDDDEAEKKESTSAHTAKASDLDLGGLEHLTASPRKLVLTQSILCAATLFILVLAIGSGWRQIAIQMAVDGQMLRIAFVAVVPIQMWLALFFMQSVVGSLAQLLGPISQVKSNSKYFSGLRPTRLHRNILPHVTIQCPVYKEGLHSVIGPTIKSLKAAISTYEMQGGTANIFVNDDGMQLISGEERATRQDFYLAHNIGWVARPKHNPLPKDGEARFIRAGKFKKASNMNYAMAVSSRIEDKLAAVHRSDYWTKHDENMAYSKALKQVISEDGGQTWAEGNIRLGDYILLIDSDTRVPADCLLDAVSEMEQSPQVAIVQFSSGVMNVTTSFFENGITFFTNLIYTAITYAVACGDVAPFVGHNAILRWSALQDIAYHSNGDAADTPEKYWSEATVSEDFDMALRLQTAGYIIRFASYLGDGFQEGVSLTVYDELARWEKYAYGCNELIFHPLRFWLTHGPVTPLFRRFITSNMPLASKITIMAYIGTYYAIASAWILTLMNYLVIGWFNGYLDHYYVDSFKIFFSIIVVFTALGNLALALLRYRLGTRSLGAAFAENFQWVFLLAIFLGGLSMHVSQAILSHMFSVDMSWGATAKEVENTTFFAEVPKLLRRFKWTFGFCVAMTVVMVYLATSAPLFWQIDSFIAIFPMANVVFAHFWLPIALNPNLMLFTW